MTMNRKQNDTSSLRTATPKKLTAGDPGGAPRTEPDGSAEIDETVLFDAVRLGDVDDVNFLMSAGAVVNATDGEGWTPLMWATVKGYAEVARALLAAGADVHLKNNKGWTALRLAVSLNDTELTRPLIDAGADVNDRDQKGSTALMQAAGEKSVESLELLLSYGADVNLTDEAGDTAMAMAARNGYAEIVRRLADAGATSEREHRTEETDGGLFSESELQHLIEKMDGFLPSVPAPAAVPTPTVDVLEIQDLAPVAAASPGTLERLASALEALRSSTTPASRVSVADAAHKLMLSLPEAAALSGLSRRHLGEAMKEGSLKSLRTGKGWRIKRAHLDAYVKRL